MFHLTPRQQEMLLPDWLAGVWLQHHTRPSVTECGSEVKHGSVVIHKRLLESCFKWTLPSEGILHITIQKRLLFSGKKFFKRAELLHPVVVSLFLRCLFVYRCITTSPNTMYVINVFTLAQILKILLT